MQTTQATQVGRSWRKWLGLACAAAVTSLAPVALTGCASDTGTGTLVGAGAGAVAGNLIGKAVGGNGSRTAGTLIGGGLGALAGNAVGQSSDRQKAQQAAAAQAAAQVQAQQDGLRDIAQLAANGTGEAVIINKVRTGGVVYNLSADQIGYLQQNHVSDAVITEMQATAYRAQFVTPRPVYVAPPQPSYSVGVAVGGR
jgi:hypothetical protein